MMEKLSIISDIVGITITTAADSRKLLRGEMCMRQHFFLFKWDGNCFNPFVPNAHFLYPLKSSEHLEVF